MRRIFGILLFLILLLFFKTQTASAAITVDKVDPILINDGSETITLTADQPSFIKDKNYTFSFFGPGETVRDKNNVDPTQVSTFNARSVIVKPQNCQDNGCTVLQAVQDWRNFGPMQTSGLRKTQGTWTVVVFLDNFNTGRVIDPINFTMLPPGATASPGTTTAQGIPAIGMKQSNFQAYSQATVYILNAAVGTSYTLWFSGEQSALTTVRIDQTYDDQDFDNLGNNLGAKTASSTINMGSAGPKTICMTQASTIVNSVRALSCDYSLGGINVTTIPPSNSGGIIFSNQTGLPTEFSTTPAPTIGPLNPQCPSGDCPSGLGFSLSTEPAKFVQTIFGIILSLAGGIAIILIIMSGYALIFAGGNPEKIQASRDQLTAAIIGLLFIIFSMSILQIVGVDILHIPGLTRTP